MHYKQCRQFYWMIAWLLSDIVVYGINKEMYLQNAKSYCCLNHICNNVLNGQCAGFFNCVYNFSLSLPYGHNDHILRNPGSCWWVTPKTPHGVRRGYCNDPSKSPCTALDSKDVFWYIFKHKQKVNKVEHHNFQKGFGFIEMP